MSLFAAADLTKIALFEGFMDGRGNSKPFSEFPFDTYLLVRSVRRYEALYEEPDGTVWTIDHNALTAVTQIEIDAASVPTSSYHGVQPTPASGRG